MNPNFNLLLIFSLFVQINSESISLKTKEEIITHSYGNYTKNILESGPTTILFNIPDFEPKNPQFEFKVNNEELSVRYSQAETLAKTPYYYYQQKGNIFEVSLIVDNDKAEPGLYDLKITEGERIESSKSQLNSPPILPEVHKPKRVLEGDQLRLKCIAKAYPMINQYIWEFGYMDSEKGENEEFQIAAINNLTTIDDVNENELIIKSLEKNNNGLYRCTAKNSLGSDQVTYFVNVKNRWAALWPFIGIVIEVAVLVSAILIYEHHSMKNKSRTPNNTTQSNNNVNPINNLESVPEFRESVRERNTPKI